MEIEIKTEYQPNGKPDIIRSYLNGRRHGYQKIYYGNGNLALDYHMKNGKVCGIWKRFNIDRSLQYISSRRLNTKYGIEINLKY